MYYRLLLLYLVIYFFPLQFHGGTNFGRTAGGPFIATSYDYDALIDEYGRSLSDKNLLLYLLFAKGLY